jgi:AcrR family transcriptional regulator
MIDPIPEADAKHRLLEAAEEIFADYGYEGASVRQICNRAGVNIAGVNYHFGDKENLYVEAVKRAHTCSARDMPIDSLAPPGASPLVRLELFIRGMVASMHAPARPSAMKLMMREMAHPGKAAGVVVDEFIRPLAFHLREILRELLPHLDEQRLLMTGFSVMGQCLFYRQSRPVAELIFGKDHLEALTADMVADHVVRFTMAAIDRMKPATDDTDRHG